MNSTSELSKDKIQLNQIESKNILKNLKNDCFFKNYLIIY